MNGRRVASRLMIVVGALPASSNGSIGVDGISEVIAGEDRERNRHSRSRCRACHVNGDPTRTA